MKGFSDLNDYVFNRGYMSTTAMLLAFEQEMKNGLFKRTDNREVRKKGLICFG